MNETELRELLDLLITAAGEEHIAFEQGRTGTRHTQEVENTKAFIIAFFRKSYVDALEWAASWVSSDASTGGHSDEVKQFAHDMAMSIRAQGIQAK